MKKIDTPQGPFAVAGLVDYAPGSVVSRQLTSNPQGNITLFAFDEGQQLSEHSAPFDAVVMVVDGEARIRLAGKDHAVASGQMLIMPANVPHALFADKRFKMTLTMIKGS